MEELLTKLYDSLCEAFQENLKPKEIFKFDDESSIDVFKTLMFLKKHNNVLNNLMLQGAVSIDEMKYLFGTDNFNKCLGNKYIIRGNSINSDKVFIGANGLFMLYSIKNYNTQEVFIAFDSNNFILDKALTLKSQEKIWCIFLLIFGADSKKNQLDTKGLSIEKLKSYREFLISIENEIIKNDLNLGSKIGWDTGKEKTFRGLIQSNKNLSKTPVYMFSGYQYYLDLSKRKNAKYLLDLILDRFKGEQRLIANDLFYNTLKELSYKLNTELGEIPSDINQYVIEELKG